VGVRASADGRPHLVVAGESLDDVVAAAERGIQRIPSTPHLTFSFLRSCGLSLWSAACMADAPSAAAADVGEFQCGP